MLERQQSQDERVVQSITNHLKKISRKVLQFNTREEVINYIIDIFISKLNCDFVALTLAEEEQLVLMGDSGDIKFLNDVFPLPVKDCNPQVFERSIRNTDANYIENSLLQSSFAEHDVSSWFTIPVNDDEDKHYGVCIVGYQEKIVMYEDMAESFDELGQFIAIALNLVNRNESKEKKILNMESIYQNFEFEDSITGLVEKVTTFCGKETKSNNVSIYLLDDERKNFIYHLPAYGYLRKEHIISVNENELIENYFSHVEEIGYGKITIPLQIDMNIIGVIYCEKASNHFYSRNDLEILQMYANYFTAMFENVQFTVKEKEQRQQMELLLKAQQAFIKETIEENNFEGINALLGEMLSSNILLYDRFFNGLGRYLLSDNHLTEGELKKIKRFGKENRNRQYPLALELETNRQFMIYVIDGGGERHGFLVVETTDKKISDWSKLAIDMAVNIYALQFTKQKMQWNNHENVKDLFIQKLVAEEIEDIEPIVEYANIFHWDLSQSIEIAVVDFEESKQQEIANIVTEKAKKTRLFRQIKQFIADYDNSILSGIVAEQLVLLTPAGLNPQVRLRWEKIYHFVEELLQMEGAQNSIVMGIGECIDQPTQYYESYQKAVQTVKVLKQQKKYGQVAFYNDLGAYTILNEIKETTETKTFIKNKLQKLYEVSSGQQVNLFQTLKAYLEHGGNIKQTSEHLFIHRSTLTYRLENIKDILEIDIQDVNTQFNLLLAYRLLDLYDEDRVFL